MTHHFVSLRDGSFTRPVPFFIVFYYPILSNTLLIACSTFSPLGPPAWAMSARPPPLPPTSAAILSLANVSAGPPGSRSARLAAAASQSTRARDSFGLFISSAGAALAMNRAMPTRKARFNPASLVLPASQDQSDPRVKCIESRHTRSVSFGVGCPATPGRAGEDFTKNDSARNQFDGNLKRRS